MQEIWYDIVLYDYQTNQDRTARLYHHDQVCECWRKSLWSNVYKYSLISRFNSSFFISFDFSFYFNSNLRLQKQTNLLLLLLLLLLHLFFQLSKCNSPESSSFSSQLSSPLSQSQATPAMTKATPAHPHAAPGPRTCTAAAAPPTPRAWDFLALPLVAFLIALVRSSLGLGGEDVKLMKWGVNSDCG